MSEVARVYLCCHFGGSDSRSIQLCRSKNPKLRCASTASIASASRALIFQLSEAQQPSTARNCASGLELLEGSSVGHLARDPLSHHHATEVGIAARDYRHHRCIGDAQVRDAMHPVVCQNSAEQLRGPLVVVVQHPAEPFAALDPTA